MFNWPRLRALVLRLFGLLIFAVAALAAFGLVMYGVVGPQALVRERRGVVRHLGVRPALERDGRPRGGRVSWCSRPSSLSSWCRAGRGLFP